MAAHVDGASAFEFFAALVEPHVARLGASARPYVRSLLPDESGWSDTTLGCFVGAAAAAWVLFTLVRLYFVAAPGKQQQPPRASATEDGGGGGGGGDSGGSTSWGVLTRVRALANAIDARLDRYDKEIKLAVRLLRGLVGAGLVAYGVAARFGLVDFRRYLDGEMSAEAAAAAEFNWMRFSAIGGVGLGIVVLLPILLPPVKKDRDSNSTPDAPATSTATATPQGAPAATKAGGAQDNVASMQRSNGAGVEAEVTAASGGASVGSDRQAASSAVAPAASASGVKKRSAGARST